MMLGITDGSDICECHRCIKEKGLTGGELFGKPLPLSASKMILCGECGNKRCPKASDHRLYCTGSNDPGQPGSVYAVTHNAELSRPAAGDHKPRRDREAGSA